MMKKPHLSSTARIVAAIAILIAAASAVAVSFGDTAASQDDPRHVVIPMSPVGIDFGVVEIGDTADGSITLVNNGDKPLHVLSAKASCGCTTLRDFEPFTIKPDEKKKIELTMKAPDKPGLRKTRHITFKIEDRDDLKVPLIIETPEASDA